LVIFFPVTGAVFVFLLGSHVEPKLMCDNKNL
jgi:hypothetical protein